VRTFSSNRIMLRRQTDPVCPATTSRSALLETVTAAGFALLLALPASYAAEDCASIRDPDQRLACYDRSFPPSPAEPTSAEAEDTSNQTDQGLRAMERLMGMLLVMLATQMLLNGIAAFHATLG